MLPSLVRKTLRDFRRSIGGWAVGIGAVVSVYSAFYTVYKGDTLTAREAVVPENVLDFLGTPDFTTGAGYLHASVYALLVPLLLALFAAGLGARAIAGPEESGTLELLLANPIGRRRFAVERFAAVAAGVVAVTGLVWVLVLVYDTVFGMGVSVARVSAASLGLMLLTLCFSAVAFAAGAATGRRAAVVAVTGTVVVGSYLINAFGGVFSSVRPLRWLSPFHYYLGADPLRTGFHAGYLLVLAGLTVALVAVAAVTFDRRDVGV